MAIRAVIIIKVIRVIKENRDIRKIKQPHSNKIEPPRTTYKPHINTILTT